MKRAATVFTCINVLAVIIMLLLIGYLYSMLGVHVPQAAAFDFAAFFIPVFVIINVIWLRVRRRLIDKQPCAPDLHAVNDRKRICIKRLNTVGLALNVLLFAAMVIHTVVLFVQSGSLDLLGVLFRYSLPFVLINDAWVVISVNMDDRLDERNYSE